MAAIKSLCSRGIVLENGEVVFNGKVEDSILSYLKGDLNKGNIINTDKRKGNGIVKVNKVEVFGDDINSVPISGSKINFLLNFENLTNVLLRDIRFDFRIDDVMGQRIVWFSTVLKTFNERNKVLKYLNFEIERCNLNQGIYYVTTYAEVNNELSDHIQNAFSFEVFEGDFYNTGKKIPVKQSKILMDFNINV
jgi:lipopolysaccharide transport system ATP-binding protein